MQVEQRTCGRQQLRRHHLGHEPGADGKLLVQTPLAPSPGAEIDVLVDIQATCQVLAIELIVAAAVQFALGPTLGDHELAESVVGIAGDQGAIEIEQREPHSATSSAGGRSSASIRLSKGTVTRR